MSLRQACKRERTGHAAMNAINDELPKFTNEPKKKGEATNSGTVLKPKPERKAKAE